MAQPAGPQLSARPARLGSFILFSLLSLSLLSGCGEDPDTGTTKEDVTADDEADDESDDEAAKPDTGAKPPAKIDAGTTPPPVTPPVVTPPKADAGSKPAVDAGSTVMSDAGATPAPTSDAAAPDPFAPGDRTPNKDNPKECPAVAPENPIGDCIGVGIYATCGYTTYNCICDWYHWICI